jgi:hypothetical protein
VPKFCLISGNNHANGVITPDPGSQSGEASDPAVAPASLPAAHCDPASRGEAVLLDSRVRWNDYKNAGNGQPFGIPPVSWPNAHNFLAVAPSSETPQFACSLCP